MTEKSYVSMEQKICPVCGVVHTYKCGILMDRKIKDSMERYTVTGYGLCEEHDKMWEDGYVALVVIDEAKSHFSKPSPIEEVEEMLNGGKRLSKEEASEIFRTGELIHIRKQVFRDLIDPNYKEDDVLVFIGEQVASMIKKMVEKRHEKI